MVLYGYSTIYRLYLKGGRGIHEGAEERQLQAAQTGGEPASYESQKSKTIVQNFCKYMHEM